MSNFSRQCSIEESYLIKGQTGHLSAQSSFGSFLAFEMFKPTLLREIPSPLLLFHLLSSILLGRKCFHSPRGAAATRAAILYLLLGSPGLKVCAKFFCLQFASFICSWIWRRKKGGEMANDLLNCFYQSRSQI